MCGISGVASVEPLINQEWLHLASESIAHRGPDASGKWWSKDKRVGLAHKRLSILDLSQNGNQPMHFLEKGLSVTFNGEIYNYLELKNLLKKYGFKFKSSSDTEILLASYAKWGVNCVKKLNGMFSFAIYDSKQKIVFIARDRAGEKPLFYHLKDDSIYFASELKALLAHPDLPRRIESEALDCYLTMGFVPGHRCILQGYNKLPPAHAMTFCLMKGTSKVWRYWKIPELESKPGDDSFSTDGAALIDELDSLIEDAVGRQMVADVPVGILLSGGVDSSIITAMAVRRSSKVRTFSIGFPGHGKMDETLHARLIARHFGTQHTELVAEPASADILPTLAHQFDEPMVDSSMIPTWLVSNLVRKHCTVALGGDGGDELFGGYDHYSRLLWMQDWLTHIPFNLRRGVADIAKRLLPVGVKGRNYLQGLGFDIKYGLPLIAKYFDSTIRKEILSNGSKHSYLAESIWQSRVPSQVDLLQRATRMDFENYLAEDILVKVDRASMLNSLEIRAPFLDYHLLEFAFSRIPSNLKASKTDKKILLKQLAKRVLPSKFDFQRKQGFSIPMSDWLKAGPFRDLFWDTLTSNDVMFDINAVGKLLNGQDRGRNNGERLFALVQFEFWRKAYKITF